MIKHKFQESSFYQISPAAAAGGLREREPAKLPLLVHKGSCPNKKKDVVCPNLRDQVAGSRHQPARCWSGSPAASHRLIASCELCSRFKLSASEFGRPYQKNLSLKFGFSYTRHSSPRMTPKKTQLVEEPKRRSSALVSL